MADRIDVSIEHKGAAATAAPEEPHPNTCPSCGSHYRDDELVEAPVRLPPVRPPLPGARARARSTSSSTAGSFVRPTPTLRSDDPLDFFDLRPYAERLVEAEMTTGLATRSSTGHGTLDGAAASSR